MYPGGGRRTPEARPPQTPGFAATVRGLLADAPGSRRSRRLSAAASCRRECARVRWGLGNSGKKMFRRRQRLQRGAIGGAGVALGRVPLAAAATPPTGVTPKLRRWVEPMPVPWCSTARAATRGSRSWRVSRRRTGTTRPRPRRRTRAKGGAPYLGLMIEAAEVGPADDRVAEQPRQDVPPQRPDAHGRGHAGTRCRSSRTSRVDLPPRGLGVALPGWLRAAASGALRLQG
jgi:hypothetical protein